MLNHQLLLTLIEKVNGIQINKELWWDVDDSESEADWGLWMETELPEEVDKLQDPDYIIPDEEIVENWVATNSFTRKYNLRNRLHSSKK